MKTKEAFAFRHTVSTEKRKPSELMMMINEKPIIMYYPARAHPEGQVTSAMGAYLGMAKVP